MKIDKPSEQVHDSCTLHQSQTPVASVRGGATTNEMLLANDDVRSTCSALEILTNINAFYLTLILTKLDKIMSVLAGSCVCS
jgi:hypothetical protein